MAAEKSEAMLTKAELKILARGLAVMKAQFLRAKTKEASDIEMTDIYDKKIATLNALEAKLMTGPLF